MFVARRFQNSRIMLGDSEVHAVCTPSCVQHADVIAKPVHNLVRSIGLF